MEHLIDYDILKKWGFVTASTITYNEKTFVDSYVTEKAPFTDFFAFNHIMMSVHPQPNIGYIWVISVMSKHDWTIFKGKISGKVALQQILKSCIIFKP